MRDKLIDFLNKEHNTNFQSLDEFCEYKSYLLAEIEYNKLSQEEREEFKNLDDYYFNYYCAR